MTTEKFTKVKETEKAVLFVVGFKFNENSPSIIYGVDGNENLSTGYLVQCWMPKSVISGNVIADWFSKKIYESFGRFNPIMGDVVFN